MKLTKGKISKLYNKKNQSLKRKNYKKGTSFKTKTFRNKRNINLANKSLKRIYKGGTTPPENTQDIQKLEEQLANIEQENAKLEEKIEEKKEETNEPASTAPINPLIQNNNDEQGINEAADNVTPVSKSLAPVTNNEAESLAPVTNEAESLAPIINEAESLAPVSNNETAIVTPSTNEPESVEPVPIIESTPTPSANTSEIPSINNDINAQVNQLIATVAEKTAKQIAEDVALKIPSTNEGQQNGFNAVQEATEKMTTGGKHKTRRFKLTNRRKTRKHKT